MILNDREIRDLNVIEPFEERGGKPSYGLGSFGYDIRLSDEFMVPKKGKTFSPLRDNSRLFKKVIREHKYVLFPNTFVLGRSIEYFKMPPDVTGLCWGKSTYARLGCIVNVTPLEAGWEGYLVIEISNLGPAPVELIVGQGIAQVVFFKGNLPNKTYSGVYQNQNGLWLNR